MSGSMLTIAPEDSPRPPDCVHVVLGIIRRGGQILVAWRDARLHQGGRWEFPGGKVALGETPQQALRRELYEELGIAGVVAEPVIRFTHDYGDCHLLLDTYEVEVDEAARVPRRAGSIVRWRTPGSLRAEEFPPANRSILSALRLPRFYAIVSAVPLMDSCSSDYELESYFDRLSGMSVRLVLLRARDISADDYLRLARRVVGCTAEAGVKLLLHDRPEVVESFGAAGVHLSQSAFSSWRYANPGRPVPSGVWFAVSCHSRDEVRAAEEAGADFCVLGPVRKKPGYPAHLGFAAFAGIVDQSRIPVYALGGMRRADISRVRSCGAQGIAGIRCFVS